MKKINLSKISRLHFLLKVLLILAMLASCIKKDEKIKIPELGQIIKCDEYPIAYKEVQCDYGKNDVPIPGYITRAEALEDIEVFEYLIKTSYAGYEYWKLQGVDFDDYFSELKDFSEQRDSISINEFEQKWSRILDSISDGHIGLQGKNSYGAYQHKSVYFCDIVIEKTEESKYKVINSQFEPVKPGDFFTPDNPGEHLFKTLSPAGANHFLIGVFSNQTITSKLLSFNNKSINIPFYQNRLAFVKNNPAGHYTIEHKHSIPVVNISSFANEIYPVMQEFMESGYQLKAEEYVIVNVMNNGGGSSLFPQTFISNLNGTVNWQTYWGELTSPPIVAYFAGYDLQSKAAQSPGFRQVIEKNRAMVEKYQSSPVKKWECSTNAEDAQPGNFTGTLIVLANRNVLSAGEAFVGSSASVKNRILVGENTGGSGMFSSACDYYLPNSKFIAKLPRHLILIPDFEECRGFLPDYWLNTSEPVKEILTWLEKKQEYQFSYANSFDDFLRNRGRNSDLVFPEDMSINPPATEIPEALARFSGQWFGVDRGMLNTAIVVEEIHTHLEADVIYAWGAAPGWHINEAGWRRFRGTYKDNVLVLDDASSKLTISLKMMQGGKMEEIYQRPGIYSKIILTKIENNEQ